MGVALLQYTFTRMEDEEGYSPLFSEGVVRDEHRDSLYFQYRRPAPILGSNAQILANIYFESLAPFIVRYAFGKVNMYM